MSRSLSERYDVIVIGGGAAGMSAAQAAVALGKRPLLISEGPLGGECTWNGCVPSKALIEAAHIRDAIARAGSFGIRVGGVSVDFPAVMERVQRVINDIARFEDEEHLEAAGVAVRRGRAQLTRDRRVLLDGETLEASRVVLATGSHPAIPEVPGLAAGPYLTNESLFTLTKQPSRLLVMGAGPIGLEIAQAFTRLGTTVEVVDLVPDLLPREDPDIAARARAMLEAEGIRFTLGARPTGVSYDGDGVAMTLDLEGEARVLGGDALLVATGRRPRIADLGLAAAGVAVGRGGITVDEHLRTTAAGVYAAGDVTGILPFTHAAAYQGRLAARNALGKRAAASYRTIPWIIFTAPEVAHVGLTEPEARKKHGADVRVAVLPFSAIDRAVISGHPRGLIKVITAGRPVVGHAGGGSVVGAHAIGEGAGELIHEFVIAMETGMFSGRLAQAVHAYPSISLGVQQVVAHLFDVGRVTAGPMREELADAP